LLHTLILVAQEHGGEAAEGHNPLIPQTGELIYGSIAFLFLLWLLGKYVYPPLNRLLEERRDSIEGRLEQAERALREAAELRDRRAAQLEEARDEASRIVEQGRRQGEETRQDIIAQAEADAARKLAQADAQITAERERAIGEVRRDVGELAVQLAERIVGESLDAELQQRVVGRFVEELATTGTPAREAAPAGSGAGDERGGTGG
jgi:F-type H+-transporting ATPase subunit b